MSIESSVNPVEIQKFAELKAYWWDKEGPLKTLHDINPLRIEYIENRCTLKGSHVLDMGCGGGILALALAQKGAIVTAIDAEKEAIGVLLLEAERQSISITAKALPVEDFQTEACFDVICCMELLEHVEDYSMIIEHAARLLKPGGHLFLSTLNRTAMAYLSAIVGAEYILSLLPRQTHDYQRFIRPSELAKVLRHFNFRVEEISGMDYSPLSRKAHLVSSVQVNYFMYAVLESISLK